jgi:hypothetical protein
MTEPLVCDRYGCAEQSKVVLDENGQFVPAGRYIAAPDSPAARCCAPRVEAMSRPPETTGSTMIPDDQAGNRLIVIEA